MMDQWTDRLSEYVDGTLEAEERRQVEAHVSGCEACTAIADELRAVAARASTLADRSPARDLWPGIASRIAVTEESDILDLSRARARRRFAFTVPQLVAASIGLILFSAGGAWLMQPSPVPAPVAAASVQSPVVQAVTGTASYQHYDRAVAELSLVLEAGRARLNPGTVRILERNLRVIDAALAEAVQAVADDPASVYLQDHLANTMQRKLALIRQAADLVTAAS
ncbi:MAG: hypothetical protein E4H37_03290 [Gemmatimonadales bacterium]|jgi:anti-sigma factor RsiW|nr:MAG: hypothetical protein E4H37_03290 [Gemmatimonadales bacterium]